MKNSFWLGSLLGIVAPLLAFLLANYTNLQTNFFADKPIAIYVLAAVVNLVVVRFTFRAGKQQVAKGVLLITFLAMLVLLWILKIKV